MRFALLLSIFALTLTGCRSSEPVMQPAPPSSSTADTGPTVAASNPMNVQPEGPAPSFAPDIDPQMQAVVEQLMAYEQPGYPELTGFQARMLKTPTNAVMDLMKKTGHGPMPPTVDIAHKLLPVGPDQGIVVRTYTPLGAGSGPLPVVVYYHGGGWVIADLDTYEAAPMALATMTGAVVVSVAYRRRPSTAIRRPTGRVRRLPLGDAECCADGWRCVARRRRR